MELSSVFAERLTAARKAHGYTQRELAEKIGYSEKAVSKWECGGTLPPVAVLLEIATVLHTTMGALLESPRRIKYYLGIDGGGTKTAFLLEDAEGRVLAAHKLAATNPNDVGMETCLARLREGILAVTAGLSLGEIAVFAGIAGGGLSGNNVELIKRSLDGYGFGAVGNGSDAENSLEIALHGRDGVAVIAGTGTIAFAQSGGKCHRIAGWGYLFDGAGSGYDVGRDGVSAALRHIDGRGKPTMLTALLEKRLQKSVPDAIPELYQGGKRYIASLAPTVFEAAHAGDSVALEIVDKNASALAEMIATARSFVCDKATPVVLCGGLAHHKELLQPRITAHLNEEIDLQFSTEEMVHGAVARARRMTNE